MSTHIENLTDASFAKVIAESEVPVLVDYWAEWCGPCCIMSPIVEALGNDYAGRIKVVKVDIDANPKITSEHHIRSIPTLMLFQDGHPISTRIGTQSRSQLAQFVDASLSEAAPA